MKAIDHDKQDGDRTSYVLYDQPPARIENNFDQAQEAQDPLRTSANLAYLRVPNSANDPDNNDDYVAYRLIEPNENDNSADHSTDYILVNDDCLDDATNRSKVLIAGDEDDFAYLGVPQVGIYGWRKKMLYLLLAAIVVLVGINAILTAWIVSFLGLSSNGITGIDLSRHDRIIFRESAIFEKLLFASEIASYRRNNGRNSNQQQQQQQQHLRFTQYNGGNITFRSNWFENDDQKNDNQPSREANESDHHDHHSESPKNGNNTRMASTKLIVAKNRVVIEANSFELFDRNQRPIFAINIDPNSGERTMSVRTDKLNIDGINSLRLPLSLQTRSIEGNILGDLRLYSAQGSVRVRGPHAVGIESKFGDISLMSFDTIAFRSNGGKITLETARGIFIRNLTEVLQSNNQDQKSDRSDKTRFLDMLRKPKVFQLCICGKTGKLFAAKPDQRCSVQSDKDCL